MRQCHDAARSDRGDLGHLQSDGWTAHELTLLCERLAAGGEVNDPCKSRPGLT